VQPAGHGGDRHQLGLRLVEPPQLGEPIEPPQPSPEDGVVVTVRAERDHAVAERDPFGRPVRPAHRHLPGPQCLPDGPVVADPLGHRQGHRRTRLVVVVVPAADRHPQREQPGPQRAVGVRDAGQRLGTDLPAGRVPDVVGDALHGERGPGERLGVACRPGDPDHLEQGDPCLGHAERADLGVGDREQQSHPQGGKGEVVRGGRVEAPAVPGGRLLPGVLRHRPLGRPAGPGDRLLRVAGRQRLKVVEGHLGHPGVRVAAPGQVLGHPPVQGQPFGRGQLEPRRLPDQVVSEPQLADDAGRCRLVDGTEHLVEGPAGRAGQGGRIHVGSQHRGRRDQRPAGRGEPGEPVAHGVADPVRQLTVH
jgi:hypothetical protein